MISDRIKYIIERIDDILSVDYERNQILKMYSDYDINSFLNMCMDLSDFEREEILDVLEMYDEYSLDQRMKIVEVCEIKEIQDIMEALKREVMMDITEVLEGKVSQDIIKVLKGMEIQDILKVLKRMVRKYIVEVMYDDKKENCIQLIRNPKLCKKIFQLNIGQYPCKLGFLVGHDEEKEVVLSDDVKIGISKLSEKLTEISNHLRIAEQDCGEQELQQSYKLFNLALTDFANSSDQILDHSIGNNDVSLEIGTLLKDIQNFINNPPFTQFIFINNVNNNTNSSGHQIIESTNVHIYRGSKSPNLKQKSYGHEVNSDIVGFNDEIGTILNLLRQPHDKTLFLGIEGQGGSGKTTLAKHIYHHPQLNTHFDCKAWVCISSSWDKTCILNSIWRQVNQDFNAREMGYDQLVECLSGFLYSKSYLVILDDIWDRKAWFDISPALPSNSGSTVVVTTRIKDVIQYIGRTVVKVELQPLKDNECLELFRMNASLFNEGISDDLLPLWKKMVKKCGGLPLAIVALAGVLGMDENQSSWERISQKMLKMETESTKGVVKDILALSFYELPHYLKPCVLYLRFFPEDAEIEAQKLAQLWMAEGFLSEESEAEECLVKMAQRHIIEDVKKCVEGKICEFRIHDLIRQMLVDVNQERGLLKDSLRLAPTRTICDGVPEIDLFNVSERECDEYLGRFFGLETVLRADKHARSAICFDFVMPDYFIMKRFFVRFRVLRVLVLHRINHNHILKEIGNLVHLRYLELEGVTCELPRSFANLGKLWTLNLSLLEIYGFIQPMQVKLWKLKELRHLYWSKFHVPCEIQKLRLEKLRNLKTLWNATGGEWMLLGMPNLSNVLQELCIHGIRDKEQLEAVFRTPSLAKNNIHTLELTWTYGIELQDLSCISNCKSLKRLKLNGGIGESTPLVFPSNLNELEMDHTRLRETELMSKINESCPRLKTLILGYKAYVRNQIVCNADSFLQLEKLQLEFLDNLKLWIIEESAVPKLHHLTIAFCELLDLNPQGWKRILEIPQESLLVRCRGFEEKLRLRRNSAKSWSVKKRRQGPESKSSGYVTL